MKKILLTLTLFILLITAAAVSADIDYSDQIDLIAANASLWKQDVDFGRWGFTLTDLDHNGRLEIIAASVQGTGFYTYLNVFEVNEDHSALTELQGPSFLRTDSSPDVMVSSVPLYHDKENDRYYYIFDDMIRNGMAEYYENKRAVSITDGKWEETFLASKSTLYADADHFTVTCTDGSGNTISEIQYDQIAQTVYGAFEPGKAEFNWQMTDNEEFAALTPDKLRTTLRGTGLPRSGGPVLR